MAMEPPGTARTIEKSPFGVDYEVDYDIFSTLENLSDTYRAPKDRFENGATFLLATVYDGDKLSQRYYITVINVVTKITFA